MRALLWVTTLRPVVEISVSRKIPQTVVITIKFTEIYCVHRLLGNKSKSASEIVLKLRILLTTNKKHIILDTKKKKRNCIFFCLNEKTDLIVSTPILNSQNIISPFDILDTVNENFATINKIFDFLIYLFFTEFVFLAVDEINSTNIACFLFFSLLCCVYIMLHFIYFSKQLNYQITFTRTKIVFIFIVQMCVSNYYNGRKKKSCKKFLQV
ncbi:hypothetical protein RFI_22896, partial [Reticulomyxa filosa]